LHCRQHVDSPKHHSEDNPLYPGEVLRLADLQQAEKKLAALGLFEVDAAMGVRPTVTVLDPESDTEFKDVLVMVQAASTGSLHCGIGEVAAGRIHGELTCSRTSSFKIPFQVDAGQKLRELRLFVSDDQGKSYRLAARATPDEKTFVFRAPRDDVYWFTVQ